LTLCTVPPYVQELALVRQHVVLVSSRIVGALSRIKLSDVCAAFVKKLEERVSARKDLGARAADITGQRSQALKLCAGREIGALEPSHKQRCSRLLRVPQAQG
jgi:hypothetical protein